MSSIQTLAMSAPVPQFPLPPASQSTLRRTSLAIQAVEKEANTGPEARSYSQSLDGWVLARRSRIPSRAWNRHSIQILADFQDLGGPDESRGEGSSEVDEEEQESKQSKVTHKQTFSTNSFQSSIYPNDKALPEPPYHVFSQAKKKQLVYIVSLAGLFLPLSSNIYFPALGQIATDLKVGIALLSLTITVYMIVQGIAPSFWAPFSDTLGRRPVFVGTFLVYLAANIGLAFSNNFAALMVFRGLQAAGSSATISIGAGVIGDITTAKERGGLIGIFGGIRMMGLSVGPVFGGIITQFFDFHAIFWFLYILGAVTLFLIILLLPETLRSIAGNGTTVLTGFQRPLIDTFKAKPTVHREPASKPTRRKVTFASIIAPLRFLFEKDVFVTLFFGSIIYTVWSMVTSSTTALFQARFSLNNLQLGLVFLPNGAGCVAGSFLTGYLMDHDYGIIETRYRRANGIADAVKLDKKSTAGYPVEKARLRNIWWIVIMFVASTAAYGFSLSLNKIAVPLVLQFLIAYSATAVFSLNSALVIDLYPGAAASATAVSNLMRCSMGAIGVAFVQLIIDHIGLGVTFYLFAGITTIFSPLLVVEWFNGQRWREARTKRLKVEAERRGSQSLAE